MDNSHDHLISALAADLRPVRRLAPPMLRALSWLAIVAVIAAALAVFADLAAMWHRIAATPDMTLAVLGSIATAVTAVLAAFELSLPDRSRAWALLPLPALALWLFASGLGCLRSYVLPDTHVAAPSETRDCLVFIVGLSVPLSAALIVMLRRAYTLTPALTATMAGLAAAAAAATLLNFFHPYDAAATDLAVHALAVSLVVAGSWLAGSRALQNSFVQGVTRGTSGPN
ncbi:MAG TPA: NrsF family protein [Xanthobacteraceae bacterium]|nr:NrsF family protein [Xanthobacteraceae bacterium]